MKKTTSKTLTLDLGPSQFVKPPVILTPQAQTNHTTKVRESKSDPRLSIPKDTQIKKPAPKRNAKKLTHIYSSSHLFGGSSGTTVHQPTSQVAAPLQVIKKPLQKQDYSKMTLQTNPSVQSLTSVVSPKTQSKYSSHYLNTKPQPRPSLSTAKSSKALSFAKKPHKASTQKKDQPAHDDPQFISKLLAQASRKAQQEKNLRLHKELLDTHVSKLIDIIQAKDKQIAQLKLNQKPKILEGKSQLQKLGKAHSTVDLHLPFRSQKNDLKQFFLSQKPKTIQQMGLDNVTESEILQKSCCHNTMIEKIDNDNKSVLNEERAMSQSGIECDLIRLNRIEQERVRHQQRLSEKIFTESLQQHPATAMARSRQQNLAGSSMVITDEYVKELIENKLPHQSHRDDDANSDRTERLSFTMEQDEDSAVERPEVILVRGDEDQEDSGLMVQSPSTTTVQQHLPQLKQMRHLSSLNLIQQQKSMSLRCDGSSICKCPACCY